MWLRMEDRDPVTYLQYAIRVRGGTKCVMQGAEIHVTD
jgi:hypothetical protein